MTAEQAQSRYVELVERLKTAYGFDQSKDPEPVGDSRRSSSSSSSSDGRK